MLVCVGTQMDDQEKSDARRKRVRVSASGICAGWVPVIRDLATLIISGIRFTGTKSSV